MSYLTSAVCEKRLFERERVFSINKKSCTRRSVNKMHPCQMDEKHCSPQVDPVERTVSCDNDV